ncbi:ARM repeat-containing protein [Ramaria rubella]|nr:ARM repeat-containing protein [Ramaria rubella]
MVAQTRGGGTTTTVTPKKLQFKDKLLGKSAALSTDALLKKLQTLHQELAETDQDRIDTKSLSTVRKELIQVQILLHKDKGVKAYAACCLADILRLYAPDAPYTNDELRDIFQFFFRQLATGLKGSNSPYYNQYFHLLESLSTVKSVVLVCDLHHAEELMADIFRDLFTLIRNDLAKNVEICITEILVALIDEAQSVPHTVLESIMAQFLGSNARMDQPAYRIVVEVCNTTADKLQRYVGQYFTDIIVQHSKDDDFAEIRTAHDLIKQINRDCSSLLHNVVPQLEQELLVSEYEVRLLATQVLGEMFADKSGMDLIKKYANVWDGWQAKKKDKSPGVRIAFVEACQGIVALHPELRKDVEDALFVKLHDPDDKVRAATCKLYSQLDYETALHHVSAKQLQAVAERCLDKKYAVRIEAMITLGKLFALARPEIENGDPAAITQFAWMPQEILHGAQANTENKMMAETILLQYILPLPPKGEDEAGWTEQCLTIMKHLDERAMNMLLSLSGLKQVRPTIFERFIQCCEENNGGVIDENESLITRRLNAVVQRLASIFSDRTKAAEDMHTFAKLNEGRLYKLLKTCMDTQTDLKTLVKSSNEFSRRIEQASSSIADTMSGIQRKGSLWIINTSSIPSLVKRIQRAPDTTSDDSPSEADRLARVAKVALSYISKHCPAIHKPHVGEFAKALADEKNVRLGEVALQALAAAQWDTTDKRTRDRVIKYAQGVNVRHAKFAGRLIGRMKDREDLALGVITAIADALPDAEEDLLVGHLTTLAELVKAVPDAFEQKSDVIVGFLVKQILTKASSFEDDIMDDDDVEEWAPDDEVSWLTKARLLTIKICRNRCLTHGNSDSAADVGTPVIKMLFTLLANGGSMVEDNHDDPKVKSRLRLLAATSLVQLAAIPVYCEAIMPNLALLAVTMQDSCFQVRMGFLVKLISYLTRNKTDPRFNTIIFLTAHDPEREVRDKARSYVAYTLARASAEIRVSSFEMNFSRLIHLLAHHPDFAIATQNLQETSKYIEFFLDLISTGDNVPFLYHLAMKTKTVRDASPAHNDSLYCASELAQEIIKTRAKLNGWQLTSYPGKVKLPSDIFTRLENAETANKIMKTIYLPEEMTSWLGEIGKTVRSPNAKGKGRANGEVKGSRKRKSPSKPRAATASKKPLRKRRRKDIDDDDEDDEDDEDDDIDSAASDAEEVPRSRSSSSSSDGGSGDEKEDQLGRGARGRAKRRAKKEAKKQKKDKNGK